MAKIKIYACGGTDVEGMNSEAEIYTEPCDFILEIQQRNGTKKYRLDADSEGNLIVDMISINGLELTKNSGYPALKFVGSY